MDAGKKMIRQLLDVGRERLNLRKSLLLLLGIYILRGIIRFRRALFEWNRNKRLTLDLPTIPLSIETSKHLFTLPRMFNQLLPDYEGHDASNYSRNYLRMLKAFKSHPDLVQEGLGVLWIMNPKYTFLLPGPPAAMVLLKDYDLVREFLASKNNEFYTKAAAYKMFSDIVGSSGAVMHMDHDLWHDQRKVMDTAFTDDMIDMHVKSVYNTSVDVVARFQKLIQNDVQNEIEIELVDEMINIAMEVSGRAFFGESFGCLTHNNPHDAPFFGWFHTLLDTTDDMLWKPAKLAFKNLPLEANRAYLCARDELKDRVLKILNDRLEKYAQNGNGGGLLPDDLLAVLIKGYQSGKVTRQQLEDNVRNVAFAGHDTSAATMAWMFYLLAKNPDKARKVLDEIERMSDVKVERLKDLDSFEYVNAVVTEVLRLYPPALTARSAKTPQVLGKYVIPAGVDVFVIPYLLHHDDRYFPNPDDFIPERWLEGIDMKYGLQASIAMVGRKEAYLPFSLGAHNCVGRKLALLEIRIMLLAVVKNFELKLPPTQPKEFQEEPIQGITARPKRIKLILKARHLK